MAKQTTPKAAPVTTSAVKAAAPVVQTSALDTAAQHLAKVYAVKGYERRDLRLATLATLDAATKKEFLALERAARKGRTADRGPKELLSRIAKAQKFLAKAIEMVKATRNDDEGIDAVSALAELGYDLGSVHGNFVALLKDGWELPRAAKRTLERKVIEPGTVMCIKPKAREQFDGILETAEMDSLTVVRMVKGIVFAKTPSGDKVMISRAKLNFA